MNNTYLPCSGQSDCWSQRISLFRSIKWVRWRSWKISTCPFHVHQTLLITENTYIPCSGQSDCVRWRSWKIPTCPVQVNQTLLITENTYIPCASQSDCVRWRSWKIPTCPVQINQTVWDKDHEKYLPALFKSIRLCEMKITSNTYLPCSGQSDSVDHEKYPPALFKSIRLCEMKITK